MKTIKTQKTELRTIEFKSHTLGELFTILVLSNNDTFENENGFIFGGKIISIKDTFMNEVSNDDFKLVEFDFFKKIDSLNRKLLKL